MKHPFKAAGSVLATGALSFLLSNLLPWFWGFTSFDKHHFYGYALQPDLGVLVPTVAVILAAFFVMYGLFVAGDEGSTVFLGTFSDGYDDEPEDRGTPRLDATVNGPEVRPFFAPEDPDLDGL
jgi:hypothetical protein